jgi:hypothetical protein
VSRYLGWLNRRPYLWWVDIANRAIEPAANLTAIPQGIDELVPLVDCVAVRCGPTWFGISRSLSGDGFLLSETERDEAERKSLYVEAVWGPGVAPRDARVHLPLPDGNKWELSHPEIGYWDLSGTLSADRSAFAIGGYPPGSGKDLNTAKLVVADIKTKTIHVFDGTFHGFGEPAWSADGLEVVVGAPFEHRVLLHASLDSTTLNRASFRRDPPTPLIHESLLHA